MFCTNSFAHRHPFASMFVYALYMNGIYKVNSADMFPCHIITGPATRGHRLKLDKRVTVKAGPVQISLDTELLIMELFARGRSNCKLSELSQRKA